MTTSHRVYVGTIGEGVWRSTDGGTTYRRAADGMFVECHVRALAVHPGDSRILYLGSEQGLFRTEDGADNWHEVHPSLRGKQIWSILVHPADPDLIVVGVCPAAIFRSADAGKSWGESQTTIVRDCPRIVSTRVTTLKADPGDPNILWAGVEIDGLHRSIDRGITWQPIGQGLSSRDIHDLLFVASNGGTTLLAATNNDLNRSTSAGAAWQPVQIAKQMPWPYCRALAQPVGQAHVALLGNGDGPPGSAGTIGRSVDGGLTWTAAALPGHANSTLWSFAVHAADPQLIYASSVSGQLYRSVDQGITWSKCPREFGEIRALAWTPA